MVQSDQKRMRTKWHDPQIKIRIPIILKEKLDEAARKSARSRVAEILYRLWSSFNKEVEKQK